MAKKIFISQPMSDKTNEYIEQERAQAIAEAKKIVGEDAEVIDSFFKDAPHDAKPLWFLGKSFELLATADVVVFCKDWYKYRGCKMEYIASKQYLEPQGVAVIDLDPSTKPTDFLKI